MIAGSDAYEDGSVRASGHWSEMDNLSNAARSALMSRVRAQNTAPELIVRSLLHSLGYRFRLHRNDLPGNPDIVLSKYRTIVFVHGCFWHHHGCRAGLKVPGTNSSYWQSKFESNKARDRRSRRSLNRMGWRVLTIWECETRKAAKLTERITGFLESVTS